MSDKLRLLIFIPAYNAEKTICSVLERIPQELKEKFEVFVLVIDDASEDNTFEKAVNHLRSFKFKGEALRNDVNQGYGGNQKVGYAYAIMNNFDVVAMVHGDGQYAPEYLPSLMDPFLREDDNVDAVFGSRMLKKSDAISGGMPRYKFYGNIILTWIQNKLLGSKLSEFHSGYRLYRVSSLCNIPIDLNTNDFYFDTEIIVQILFSGGKILELPIPTFYGDEVCHVNGIKYAWQVIRCSIKARCIQKEIFYDPKFWFPNQAADFRKSRLTLLSPSRLCAETIREGSYVLDLGVSDRDLPRFLEENKGCTVFSISAKELKNRDDIPYSKLEYVLGLDVIEEQDDCEEFLRTLHNRLLDNDKVLLLCSAANVGFFIVRMMLLFGQFNYSQKGILAMTHKRLFTKSSFARLMRYAGFELQKIHFLPAPYGLALGNNFLSRALHTVNKFLMRIMPGLFAYQSLFELRVRPGGKYALDRALRAK